LITISVAFVKAFGYYFLPYVILSFSPEDRFFLVRGNHEAEEVNRVYGFENEASGG